jgi:hypothetical protein
LYTSRLWKFNVLKETQEVCGQLFADYLEITCGDNAKMAEKLCMKCALVEPFIYQIGNKTYHGFALNYPDAIVELLTQDSDELDIWIFHLKKSTIFSGFDIDYRLENCIGRGGQGFVYRA